MIGKAALARGLDTLAMFARWYAARGMPRDSVTVVATSAIRDATNRDEIVARAARVSGFDVQVLSAEEEARYGSLAAVNTTTLENGLVLDLGGGSLQLVAVRDRRWRAFRSWPLGAVRVTERLIASDRAVTHKQLKRARAALRAELSELPRGTNEGDRVVAMGGSVRNLAAAHQRARGLSAAGIQGHRLGVDDLRELVVGLAARPAAERALPGIKPARADVILAAALVLEAVLERARAPALEVTRAGLREGVLFATRMLPEHSALVLDVRAAAVANLALGCRVDFPHAEHVAKLALQLHDSMSAQGLIRAPDDECELLWAAAMLHEVGTVIALEGHPTHGRYVILTSGIIGYDPRQVALIAQIVRFHRKGSPTLEDLGALTRNGDAQLVNRCVLLLRLADQLDGGGDGAIRTARFVAERRRFRLELTGDARLARREVVRQLGDGEFRRVFGRRLVLAR